jgi:CheY-like chemotaxis protein
LRFAPFVTAAAVAALGLAALAGWWTDTEALRCVIPGSLPLKPNIAAGFLFCGVALGCSSLQQMDSIQAVLTDIALPYMDGVSVIRALKRMKPETVFIASTGQGEHSRDSELRALGVASMLTKPYDTQKLLETLKDALAQAK